MSQEPELPSNKELNRALERITFLEKKVEDNRTKIRNSKALSVLAGFLLLPLIFSGSVNLGEKPSAEVKTRDIDGGDLISFFTFGGVALGIIGYDEVLNLLRKPKG